MNNIYKVIWSKAKNCYVVASEIAKSHTKSASGSEKMGGYGKRALLALAAASAIFCGGLVNVGASVQSETISAGTTSNPVLTVDNTDDAAQLNQVILAAREDKLVTKDNISDQLTDYAKASDLSAKADANNVYSKTDAESTFATKTELGSYAKSADADAKYATRTELDAKADKTALDGKADRTYVDQKFTEAGTNVDNKLEDYYNKAEVDGKIAAEATARDTAINTAIGLEREDRNAAIGNAINGEVTQRNQAINTAIEQEKTNRNAAILTAKTELEDKITKEETARKKADTDFNTRLTTAEGKIGANETDIGDLKAADTALEGKITKNREDIATLNGKVATAEGNITDLKAKDTDLEKKIQTNADNIQTNSNAIADTNKRTAGIKRDDVRNETTIEGNVTVDNLGNVTAEGKLKGAGVEAGAVNAGSLIVTDASNLKGDVTMDKKLAVTGDTSLKKTDVDGTLNVTGESSLKNTQVNGTLTTTGKATFQEAVEMDKGLTVTSGDTTMKGTKVDGALNVTGESSLKNTKVDGTLTTTGKATFQEAVEMDKGLTVTNGDTTLKKTDVDGALTVTGESSLKNTTVGGTLGVTGATTLSGELKAEKDATFEKDVTVKGTTNLGNTTVEGDLKVTGTITTDKMVFGETPNNYTEIDHGKVTSKNLVVNGAGETISSSSTFDVEKNEVGFTNTATGDHSYHKQTADGIKGYVTDKDGNKTYTKVTATENSFQVQDKDGKNKNHQVNTKDSSVTEITNAAGATTKTEQTATDIKNTAKDGTITNEAKDIVNTATTMKTTVTGKATESYGELETTVDGQATENFNNGLNTTVTGTEKHTVNGKQINTVTEGQENIISGGQTNTITGGQINNITGDQTTTITGNKTETVTENVTEDYQKDLTTTVGGNENHEVKGTKTETVEGKVTENFKNGQETNVTGDQVIKVSGTQTTTATDINRNASSGMIDTIDNAYGTNTETKEAGKTTTDVSIKGTGEKGQYIRGANESRDYLIKGTLKNSETKTVEKTSTEITDGTNKASTRQDAKNLAGSVTNGTETGVSGIHANDDGSVSIDSGVTDGTNTSVQNQTASQIAAAVKDGAGNENASVATATTSANTIKNGTKTNTVISTVDGTSFVNSEAAAPVTGGSGAGTAVNTTIKGNTITTGKVTMDYADVMKDLGVHGNAKVDKNLEVGGTSKLTGDVTMESNATVKKDLTVGGTTTTKTLNVTENATVGGTLDVTQKATFHDDVDITKNLSVGGNATITGDVTAKSYKVDGKTYISAAGINANDQKITNVADGSISEGSKDAVNGGQLYTVKNDLEGKVNKVGANAAAMANLHPMEFDPDSKWNIAAAIGNYGSETAAALGAFYRPNDDVMVNLSTAFGTGENMVGGGVSVRLGKGGNKLSREENNALKDQVNDLTARMDALLSVLNPNMSKDFPDVPENHWAYEAVSRLAGNDIVQGYPDGEFHGERTMTRYEMAEIIYNALSRGAEAEKELVEEFKPELQAMAASEKATAEKAEG